MIKKTNLEIKQQRLIDKWMGKKKKPKRKKNGWDKLLVKIKGKSYREFLKSRYWNKVKQIVLRRDQFKCTVCGSPYNLQVHHTTYKHHRQEHKYLHELETLCAKHHKEIHSIKEIC